MDRIFGEEAVTSPNQAGTNSWDLINNLGSVVYVLDNTGAIIDQLVYDGFGIVAYESSPTVDHFTGFAGGHFDQNTGVVNDYERCYDPTTGRWLSQDRGGFAMGDTNLERYAWNRPTTFVDAFGLMPTPPQTAAQQMQQVAGNYAAIMQQAQQQQEAAAQAMASLIDIMPLLAQAKELQEKAAAAALAPNEALLVKQAVQFMQDRVVQAAVKAAMTASAAQQKMMLLVLNFDALVDIEEAALLAKEQAASNNMNKEEQKLQVFLEAIEGAINQVQ